MEISELKIKLGDIIQIKSTKVDSDLKYFFIEYVDDELIKIVNKDQTVEPTVSLSQVKIISHKEKNDWQLVPKYNIGKKPQSADK